ncbi:receptor-type tyrosine-protein phosphatase beta-like [Anguilla rostrata]|uniref:receptor-type tyrosine-protein phosphatase beta-like n=1 Tax=Anguilla rostrata TaxID=7938 RepID=UPI0030D43728
MVETSGCTSAPRNQTEQDSMATITGLTPGTNCSFTVYSQVQNGIEGEPISVYQYTKPERVNPAIPNRGANDTIEVTWPSPPGNVEKYMLSLTSNYGDSQTKFLNSSFQSHLFSGLRAGRNYTVVVTTISGPFAEDSEPVSNATYPNPPGAIHAEGQTTDSITISWGRPQGMDLGQYSFIIFYQPHQNGQNETTNNRAVLENLTSGTLYNISVVTVGPMDYQSSAATAGIYTRPYPILGLNATTINTTVVVLHWHRPQWYQQGYSYRVETSGCTSATRNQTEQDSMATITGLTPGTNCSFTVYSQVQNGIEGEPISVYQYTKPERVNPAIPNRDTNDTIEVTWLSPPSNVEKYMLSLTSNYGENQTKFLNSSFQSWLFSGLAAGRIYTVVVTTISGPFAEDSEPVSNATYPNPPGAIHAEGQTTDSITISWGRPQSLDLGQYSFIIFYQPHQNGQTETTNNRAVLENLTSGTLYNISVVTVGPMDYQSSAATAGIYTRPYPILGLNATTINTTVVVLHWHRPQGYQQGYSYRVETSCCMPTPRIQTEQNSMATITGQNSMATITDLTPGTNCSFTVYSQVQNGTEGEPISVYQYTKPERVNPTIPNRGANDTIEVTWLSPPGNVEKYMLSLTSNYGDNQTKFLNSSFQSHLFSGLRAGKIYTVIVTTISGPFAEDSEPVSNATYPNAPGPIMVTDKTTDSVAIEWTPAPGMDRGSFSYHVTYGSSAHDLESRDTDLNELTVVGLVSGTPYNISVATVGLFQYTSQPVLRFVTTRPERVQGLQQSSTTVDMISIAWQRPVGFRPGYSYDVTVRNSTGHLIRNGSTSQLSHDSTGLSPGNRYTFGVTPRTSDGTLGSPVTIPVCTDASPVVIFKCDGPNGTGPVLNLTWNSPEGANEGFRLTWGDTGSVTLPPCTGNCSHNIENLSYYTRYQLRITTLGCGKTSSVHKTDCQTGITEPERVSPAVSNRGTSDTIEVTWLSPPGNVEKYKVSLTSNYGDNQTKFLNSSFQSQLFSGLAAGRNYTVVVTTISGPFAEDSEPVSNATYPNPPGAIHAEGQTTDSITISWGWPQGMDLGQYSFIIFYQPHQNGQNESTNNTAVLGNLTSGTLYNILVVTVGPMGYHSSAATAGIYTKPERVSPAVSSRGTSDTIEVTWRSPLGNVDKYKVSLTSNYGDNQTKFLNSSFQSQLFSGLAAGRNYTVVMTTISGPFAEDSEPVTSATYPNPPGAIHAEGQTTDSITISWGRPQSLDLGQYSFIIFYHSHQNGQNETTNNTAVLENLTSGSLYNISVVTVGPMGYHSSAATAGIYTRPYPILGLNATTINTTVVVLHWHRPQGYQQGYSYRVETSCCMPTPRNQTEQNSMATITDQNSMATITDLIPGTNCSFTVYSQVQNGIEGEPISVYQYTKPERVSPAVSNRGTNDTIEVTWKPPLGIVEKYMVNLTSNYGDNQSKVVSYLLPSPLFSGLTPGRKYTVVVTTISGPFAEDSEPVSNATYPNPPGAIHAEGQTTDSITISWGRPQGMDLGQYSFIIFYQPHQNGQNETTNNTAVLENLTSGTLYNISVVTVGPMGYHSSAATAGIYTRPYPILGLNGTTINTTVVVLHWHRPQGYQQGYSYRVENSCCMPTPRNQTKQNSMATITNLIPGINCSFTVYSQVQNGVEGEPISVYQYTKPEKVSPAVSNRGTNDTIEVTWLPPLGNVEMYMVNLTSNYGDNQTKVVNSSFLSPSFSGLTPGRNYTVVVTTISGPFAEDSEPVSNATYPNPPGAIHAEEQTADSITISWGRPQGMDLGQYRFIIFYQAHQNGQTETTNNTAVLENLTSGTLYNISVVTVGPMGYHSSAATAGIYTRPYPILGLNATTINTTVVVLHWHRPQGYQQGYSYRVETSCCMPTPWNQTEQNSMATITDLIPGTNCSFTVYSQIQNGVEGQPISVYQYTKPERVSPEVSSRGTTDTIDVKWMPPLGIVEKYMVNLTSNYGDNQTKVVNSSFLSPSFSGLTPGRNYTVVVTTISGPFAEDSEPVSNATYPNPPGAIHAEEQTTDSITISWGRPQGMDLGQYSFIIFYQPHQNGQNETTNNTAVLGNLTSGTLYNISVVTVGPMDYQSSAATAGIYTRPYPILGLNATTINTTVVVLHWHRPQGYQQGYSYRVETSCCMPTPRNQTEQNSMATITDQNSMATITDLIPGINCSFTVYSQVQNGVEGEPISVYQYTKPERVSPEVSSRGTTDTIDVKWMPPLGIVEKYMVNLTSNYGDNQTKVVNSSFLSPLFSGLTPGRNYTVVVTTISGPFAEDSEPVSNATYPNPPGAIHAEGQTTDSITISWGWPQGMDLGQYSFIIFYQPHQNGQTESTNNTAVLENLTSGSLYNISVVTVGPMGYQSSAATAGIYAKPERVSPAVSNRGTNDTIEVTWRSPLGKVEKYKVNLTSNYGDNQIKFLSSSFQSQLFSGLAAGRKYTVIVTTISGPFAEDSEPVTSATYPNAPGPITVTDKTTDSVAIEWTPAPGMDRGSFSYHVTYGSSAHDLKSHDTDPDLNELTVRGLVSGTPYNISVATVGLFQYASQPVLRLVTTRPESVQGLQQSSTAVDMISIAWQRPVGFRPGYSYDVTVQDSTGHLIRNGSTSQLSHDSTGLSPGNRYTFEVTSRTSDGTLGSPVTIPVCTDASPVVIFKCDGPNGTDPVLNLTWDSPEGANKGFILNWGDTGSVTLPPCTGNCRHTIENLSYYTRYQVHITTNGCGKTSSVHKTDCQTGITAPPEPSRSTGFAVLKKKHNMFFLKFNSSILNSANGPIVAYGILMTSNLKEFSNENNVGLQKYLNKTHDDWTKDESVPYLATARTRNEKPEFVVEIGTGSRWNGYTNGPLSARTTYRFALVMFTRVALANELVDASRSLFSISKFFDEDVALPENPTVITVGALAGALSAVTCFTAIAAVVYWKKAARKTPVDIPIESMRCVCMCVHMRACVRERKSPRVLDSTHCAFFFCSGAPVRVEDYEAYHRRQSANSNCGFAREYEELKPVGIGQCKVSAEAPENKGKNRYTNVLPYESSRVKLSIQGSPYDDYINASYVPGYNCKKEFIAAQGPLPGTVDEFWRMLWEKNVRTLVMLTRCNEQGRVKCEEYWPSRTQHFKNIFVTTTSVVPLEDWTVRDFDVKNVKTAETRSLRQFHFTAWPDHGVPESTELLIDFRHLVREHMDLVSRNSPTVVHCSAGVGRTGTMIAIDHLLFQIERDSMVDLYGTVYSMRMHRALMVQTEDQYVFLHKCALDIIKSRTGTNVDLIYQNVAAVDIYENVATIKGAAGVSRP